MLRHALAGCAMLAALAASTSAASSAGITRITIERNCFGCPAASVLELRRDGTATRTTAGTARSATPTRVVRGRLDRGDFDRLARQIVARGFFDLDDVYEDPSLRDGAWTATRVARGDQEKQVVRRDDAGPAALRDIEAAIDALQQRIVFVSDRAP